MMLDAGNRKDFADHVIYRFGKRLGEEVERRRRGNDYRAGFGEFEHASKVNGGHWCLPRHDNQRSTFFEGHIGDPMNQRPG